MEKVRKEARRKLDLMRKLHRWHKVVTALAGVIVFCTTYALILPAITMTTPLVCEKEEHTHTDECYQIEMVPVERKLICSLPEAEPHTHTDDCWTQVTVPACGLEETEGHTHTDACWTETTTYICGLEETPAHAHTDECYTEVTTYTCGLEESEGHAHTADCCTRTQGELLCHKEFDTVERQVETVEERSIVDENGETVTVPETVIETVTETVPHVHTDDCYAWTDELTCGMEESEGHTHTAECAHTEKVLTCELAETEGHTHTEACVHTEKTLTCPLEETEPHTHTEDCGTEVQKVLTCGLEETEGHAHTDACYEIPENEGELVEVRTLICEKEEHTHDDNCYYGLELEEKVKYYCGFDTQHTHDESCYFEDGALKCNIPEHTHTDECLVEPLPEPVPVELDETFTAESEDGAVILNLHVTGTVLLPQTAQPAEGEEPQEEVGFQLLVTESEDYEAYDEYAEMAAKEGEVVAMGVLDYTLTYNGETVDLSGCEVTVEVEPTEAFQQFMDDPQTLESLGAMTMDLAAEDDIPAEDGVDETMEMMFTAYTQRRGTVAYAATRGANPTFTVQYYAYLNLAVRTNYESSFGSDYNAYKDLVRQNKLPLINTEGKKLPVNGQGVVQTPNGNKLAYLTVENGKIKTEPQLTEIYASQSLEYQKAPGLKYFNIVLKNSSSQYTLEKAENEDKPVGIWVLKDGRNSASIDPNDWDYYLYDKDATRFTNRPETAAADPQHFILINSGTVIRLVYGTTGKTENLPANFYDYNISDGKLYKNSNKTGTFWLGNQLFTPGMGLASDWATLYMKTNQQGINSPSNYTTGGAKLAFGNANTGSGLGDQHWNGNSINTANRTSTGAAKDSFLFCTFGLAPRAEKVTTSEGKTEYRIQFADGVDAPNLFNNGAAVIGKTTYSGKAGEDYSLNFERVGDTYTLSSVKGTGASNLTQFNHPQPNESTTHTHIYTNNFWPMDGAGAGIDATDSQFGSNKDKGRIKFDATNDMPDSDDGQYHNSYFGMQFSVTFDLTKNYVGPLEYYFFGDDDMWVFLDDQLVCDIGGVHTSVGEYVNLWDYINKADLEKLAEDETKTYTLTFYYTERGASGSTCWMQFTLPIVVGLNLEQELEKEVDSKNGSLWIEKRLTGVENTDEFEFKLELKGDGKYDNYVIQGPNGEIITTGDGVTDYITDKGTFKLRGGAVLVVQKLPENTKYKITEINNEGYHTQSETFLYSTEKAANGGEFTKTVTQGTVAEGPITVNDITKVVFTNTASYELPATGGSGTTLWYTMGTMLLLSAAYLMYKKRQWLLREEDAM